MSYRDPLIAVGACPLVARWVRPYARSAWLDQQKLTIAIDGKGYKFTISFLSFDDADRFQAQFSEADVLRYQAWGSGSSPAPSLYVVSRAL